MDFVVPTDRTKLFAEARSSQNKSEAKELKQKQLLIEADKAWVKSAKAEIRKSPAMNSPTVATLSMGHGVFIQARSADWYQIKWAFITKYLPDDFWAYTDAEKEDFRAKKEHLNKYLRSIYDQRSQTLHSGIPLPHTSYHMRWKSEIPIGWPAFELGKPLSNERKKIAQYLPTLMFIERMVNATLKGFFELKIKQESSD